MNKLSYLLITITSLTLFGSCVLFDLDNSSDDLKPQELSRLRLEADSLYQLGKSNREISNFKDALDYQSRALSISETLNDTILIVKNLNQLGTTMRRVGHLESALGYHYQALAYLQAYHEDTSSVINHQLLVTNNGIGNVHLTLGNDQMAEKYFRKSLEGDFAIDNHLGMAINYANIGSIFERADQLDSADYYYHKSMEQNELVNSTMGIGLCHSHFGDILQKYYKLQDAEKEYRKASIIMSNLNDDYHALAPIIALTKNLIAQGRFLEAHLYADTSLIIARRIHSYESLYEATNNKSQLLEKMGDAKGALEYYKQSSVWKDSLYRPASNNSISEISLEFEQEQSRRQMQKLRDAFEAEESIHEIVANIQLVLIIIALFVIALVYYAAVNRKKRIQAINNLSNMKESFFRNFASGFHSPIENMIETTQRLKMNQDGDSEELTKIEKNCKQVLKQIDAVIELSKFSGGEDVPCEWTRGNVVPFIREVVSEHQSLASEQGVKIVVDVKQSMILMDYSPSFMQKIISNLLICAIKGSSQKGGIVNIMVQCRENHLVMTGTDTGENLSFEDKQHAFDVFYQSKSSRLNVSSGLCLPYVYQLVHRLGGIITINDNEPRGIKVEVILSMKRLG